MAVPSATRPPSRGSPGVLTLDVVARQRYDKYLRTHACLIKLVPFRVKAQIRPSIKLLQCPARVAGTINLNSSACLYHQRRRQLWGDNRETVERNNYPHINWIRGGLQQGSRRKRDNRGRVLVAICVGDAMIWWTWIQFFVSCLLIHSAPAIELRLMRMGMERNPIPNGSAEQDETNFNRPSVPVLSSSIRW